MKFYKVNLGDKFVGADDSTLTYGEVSVVNEDGFVIEWNELGESSCYYNLDYDICKVQKEGE